MKNNRPHLPRPASILLLPCLILALPPAIRAVELSPSDGVDTNTFTRPVSFSGSTGLEGAYGKGNYTGAAYLYRNLYTASGTVTEDVILTASDRAENDRFGKSVSLLGSTGLAGASGKDNNTGAAYLFRNLDTASGTSTESAKLTASDRGGVNMSGNGDAFGESVSLSGNTGLVGAPGMDSYKGAAYLFRSLDTASGTVTENAKLRAAGGGVGSFGAAVGLLGNTGLVGAPGNGITAIGAAYLFRNLDTASGTVTENAKLIPSDGSNQKNYFGLSVSLSGNAGLVTAYYQDEGKGAAYLFRSLDTASGTVTENAKLIASDRAGGGFSGDSDYFGDSVSLSGSTGLVGAASKNARGAAYFYRNLDTASGTVTENLKLTASRSPANDRFGSSLTLDGDRFLIGARSKVYSGRVSTFTTLDESGSSRSTDGFSFVSQDNWVIGQNTDGNRLTLSAGDSGTVSAAGRKVMVGQNAGSDRNVLTVNGKLTANSVQVGALGNTGNSLWVGGGGIVTTTGGVIVAVGSSVGGDGRIEGDLRFSASSFFEFATSNSLSVTGKVLFDGSFGVTNLIGLDQNTPEGTYTLIDGTTTNFAASGLSNWGQANAYDLGGGKKAWFEQGSLKLVVVPESGTSLLALLAGAPLILHRRPSRRR